MPVRLSVTRPGPAGIGISQRFVLGDQALTSGDTFDMASARAFTAAESCLRSDLVTVE